MKLYFLYINRYYFTYETRGKTLLNEWQQAFPECHMFPSSSLMKFILLLSLPSILTLSHFSIIY